MLNMKNITVRYGKVEVLHEISLDVSDSTVETLIGHNGAGKTTVIRTISGQNRPTSGEIWYQGQRIDGLKPHKIVKLGISQVPEGRRVFPHMSVMENLLLGAYKEKKGGIISNTLEEVFDHFPRLKERQKQQAGSLSGGEQQMLATARALMSQPRLLLMDEPTLGLAPIVIEEVKQIIETIRSKGVTILLVEQNASMALRLANHAYVLEVGRVVLDGDSRDLLESEHVKKAYLGA